MKAIKGICPACKTEFVKSSAKQRYCKPSCRPSAYTPAKAVESTGAKNTPCAVCPEEPRCLDKEHPESCRVYRINTKGAKKQQADKDRLRIVRAKLKDETEPLPEAKPEPAAAEPPQGGMRRFQRKAALMSAIAGCIEAHGMATGDVKPLLIEIIKEM